jgi:4-hydroxy-tetrahydrodipicolinate reductase
MIRVGVLGAAGRMGQEVSRAVEEDPDLTLVAAIDPASSGQHIGSLIGRPHNEVTISGELDALLQAETEVAVDFTTPDTVMDDIRWAIDHAMHVVVGTTGITHEQLGEIEFALEREGGESNVIVAPNFAIGAVLMQRFAAQAARFFSAVEIIELHRDGKADAPSGTALDTAMRLTKERGEAWAGPDKESLEGVRGGDLEGIRVHSVRLPGLVAHQEVLFGGPGQILTIRHDSLDRSSFMPGVLLAIKSIHSRPGLTVGLEPLLETP